MTNLHIFFAKNLFLAKAPAAAIVLLPALLAGPIFAQAGQPAQIPASPQAVPSSPQAAADPTPDEEKKHASHLPKLGVNLGVFFPSNGKARDRFGKSWTSFGIGIGRPERPSATGQVSFDFSTEYKKSGDHHAFIAPIGVAYRRAFSAADLRVNSEGASRTFIPYYGVSADLVVLDLRSPEDDVHSRFRLTEGASALVGTTVGASGFAEAKYLAVGSVKSFNLSGFSVTAGIRF